MACTTVALPRAMQEDPSLLDAIHAMLCEWTAEELRGTESSDEDSIIALDDAADTVCLEGGRVASSELYAWLRQQLPPHLRPRLYEEAMRLEWPFLPPGLPENEHRPALLLRALRWHDDWGHLRDTLEEQFNDMHREGPQRKKTGQVAAEVSRIVHEVGDRNYNEGLAMAASALSMSVKLLKLEWEFRCKWAHHQPARELPRASASRPSDDTCLTVRSCPPSKSIRPGNPRARGRETEHWDAL